MSVSRRKFLLTSAAIALAGCHRRTQLTTESKTICVLPKWWGQEVLYDEALKKAVAFLEPKQSPDGAWRSDLVGTFKDGTALTPLVLLALLHADPKNAGIPKAANWLADMAKPDGTIAAPEAHGFDYPVYTSALTVRALSHANCPPHHKARDAWLKFLQERQLTEALGWRPADREFGGWGYAHGIPRKAKAGELIPPLTESNLSATTIALAALTAAKVPAEDPVFAKALVFVKRCQNWNDDVKDNTSFDDGGFFFIYDDPVRNKAGVAGRDERGRERYRSYGSMTADGIRCLQLCGVGRHLRSAAAKRWVRDHYRPSKLTGFTAAPVEYVRQDEAFYFAQSISQCGKLHEMAEAESAEVDVQLLGSGLKVSQRDDGSWVNTADASREHEPLVATSFACIAIASCWRAMSSSE